MSPPDDLSDAELRARLYRRGVSTLHATGLVAHRDEPEARHQLVVLLDGEA